jgi:hypothetical protein
MPSFQPLPWSPSPDDSLTHLGEKLLRDRMGLSVREPLEQLHRFDSLTDARLWRVGSKYLLKCVPATHHNVETALLARNLLVACEGLARERSCVDASSMVSWETLESMAYS